MYSEQFKNPIFIEYYAHEKKDCYKINLPYSSYASHTIVLCPVDEGYEKAKKMAKKILTEVIDLSLSNNFNDNN